MDVAVNAILRSSNSRHPEIRRRSGCYRFAAGRTKSASGTERGTAVVAVHDTLLTLRYALQEPKVPRGGHPQAMASCKPAQGWLLFAQRWRLSLVCTRQARNLGCSLLFRLLAWKWPLRARLPLSSRQV